MRRKHHRPRGRGKPDPRSGKEHKTQSKYSGNNEKCESCGITYGRIKTGYTYFEVWMMFWSPNGGPVEDWKYTSRGVILGKWFQLKQELWKNHREQCGQQIQDDHEVDLVAFDDPDLSDVPF